MSGHLRQAHGQQYAGSVSDKDVLADPEKYGGATVATADMLTADRIQWSLGATIGRKFSKQFAMNKQAQKVSGKNLTVIDNEGETEQTNTGGNTGGGTQGGGDVEG